MREEGTVRKSSPLFVVFLVVYLALNATKCTLTLLVLDFWETPSDALLFQLLTNFLLVSGAAILMLGRSWLLCVILGVCQSLFLFLHLAYFSFFLIPLSFPTVISLLKEGLTLLNYPGSFPVTPVMLVPFADLPVLMGVLWFRPMDHLRSGGWRQARLLGGILSVLFLLGGLGFLRCTKGSPAIWFQANHTSNQESLRWCGIGGNMLGQVLWGPSYPLLSYSKRLHEKGESRKEPFDVVLIQVESMDSQMVGLHCEGRLIMPRLTALASNGVFFPVALSYHGCGASSDCDVSVVNSVEPFHHVTTIKSDRETFENSFIKQFSRSGYRCFAFNGYHGDFFNRRSAFRRMGYDAFLDVRNLKLWGEPGCWGAADELVLGAAARRMASLPSPKLAHLILLSSHSPFENVNRYPRSYAMSIPPDLFSTVEPKPVRDYFRSMSYVDGCIGSFVADLDLTRTVVCIYGDHTYPFDTDSFRSRRILKDRLLYDFVPLLFLIPGARPYRETEHAASFLDVSPTVLSASGIRYRVHSDGVDLQDPRRMKGVRVPFRGNLWDRKELFQMAVGH